MSHSKVLLFFSRGNYNKAATSAVIPHKINPTLILDLIDDERYRLEFT